MGGVLIVVVSIAIACIAALPKDRAVLLPIIAGIVVGVIGLYDDLGTLIDRAQRDAHDRTGMILKLAGFAVVGAVAAWILYDRIDAPRLLVPHNGAYDIGAIYIPIAIIVVIATTAAVGVTDGLDMLAGTTIALAFAAFGAIALMQDQVAV